MREELRKLASLAVSAGPGEAEVVLACEVVAGALSARHAYIVRSGDPYFIRIGSDTLPTEYEIKQRGYWLIWQALIRETEHAVALADVSERLVHDVRLGVAGNAGNYFAVVLPGHESNSEMLLVERGAEPLAGADEVWFLETARPILCQLLSKVLDTGLRDRQKRQLSSLADIARAFNNASHMESALTDIATAIANASGFDWVNILVYDDALLKVIDRGTNIARYADTETASLFGSERFREQFGEDSYPPIPRRMHRGLPVLTPDIFAPDSGYAPGRRAFYERAHVISVGWFPLMFQESVLGTIDFSSSVPHQFEEAEVAFLTDLAAQVATAVKGMLLYRDLQRSKEEILSYAEKLEEASQAEHFIARSDAVTGLPNRRYLEEVLKAECARANRYREPISVLMADLDRFKTINDHYGHLVGDEALRFVAQLARNTSRSSDFVGRWGGDEFLFVMPHTTADMACVFAGRFRGELAETPYRAGPRGEDVRVKFSAGVAEAAPPDVADPEMLVARSDKALYEAKDGGRDQVRSWQPPARAA